MHEKKKVKKEHKKEEKHEMKHHKEEKMGSSFCAAKKMPKKK